MLSFKQIYTRFKQGTSSLDGELLLYMFTERLLHPSTLILTIITFFYLLHFIVLLINFGNPYSSNTWTGAIFFNGYEVITRDGKNWTRTLFSLPIRVYPCPFYRPTSSVFIVRARRRKAGAALSFFLSTSTIPFLFLFVLTRVNQPRGFFG